MDEGLVLTINPADKVHLEHVLASVENNIDLKQDKKIMVGGYLLETSSQLIDYTIEKRFQKVVHEMLLNAVASESEAASLETSTAIKELSDYPVDLLEKADEITTAVTDKKLEQEETQGIATEAERDTVTETVKQQQEVADDAAVDEMKVDGQIPEHDDLSGQNVLSDLDELPKPDEAAVPNKADDADD
jgi:flagellar assembly protein FliH